MPSGAGGRKKPFSGKQKKLQLLTKRERTAEKTDEDGVYLSRGPGGHSRNPGRASGRTNQKNELSTTLEDASRVGTKFFELRYPTTKADAGRYSLMFRKESPEELNRQMKEGRKPIKPVLEEYLECQVEDFFTPELDFPVRPSWSYDISREELERTEYRYFHEYLKKIDEKYERSDLSYFELNLETWRQLWRVLEMSDIVLCVVDIRFPALLFPPKLYDYVTNLGKHLILILNKIDLCPAPLVLAWRDYYQKKYPELSILCFTSYPSYNVTGDDSATSIHGKRRKGKQRMCAEGALELYKVCAKLVDNQVNLTSWKQKITEEMKSEGDAEEDEPVQVDKVITEKVDTSYYEFKKFSSGILTIGCVGQPNVGKSSLINGLMGKKVVSVSRTPGHTKHFQTIFLTPNVRLCDCPGLIFPSKIPKSLQVLCGSYPIAQLRDPYTTVKYLAERLDLPKILKITHPDGESEWSACDIADGWAQKRGYFTAKAARLDTYRGANQILRLALEGRIRLNLYPPGYYSSKDVWREDPRVSEILSIQAKSQDVPAADVIPLSSDEEEDADLENNQDSDQDNQDRDDSEGDTDGDQPVPAKPQTKKSDKVALHNKFALLLDNDDDDE